MHRGKSVQPERDCEYCSKSLPELRHPTNRYCDKTCRQRDRWQRDHVGDGVKCLDCGKLFNRVGSHVVQVHGYESVLEYKKEHGLTGKETRTDEHALLMRSKVTDKTISNLENGKSNRYRKGGDHSERVSDFWRNRKERKGYLETNTKLGSR